MRCLVGLALAAAAVAGCATRSEVLELAKRTGATVSMVGTQLETFAEDRRRRAELRADTMAYLDRQVSDGLNRLAERMRAMSVAKEHDKLALYRMLREDAVKLEEAYAAAIADDVAIRKRILADQAKLEAPAEGLKGTAKGLAELSKDEDFEARLRFLATFVGEIKKDIDAAEKNKEDKDKEATAKLNSKKGEKPARGD